MLIGERCGASFLNDNFFDHVLEILRTEMYLDSEREDRSTIVQRLIPHFENEIKRDIDFGESPMARLYIPSIRSNEDDPAVARKKRFETGYLELQTYVRNKSEWK